MYFPKWYEKGIITIADITDDLGTVLDIDTLKSVYGIESINPLHYLRVRQNVKELFKSGFGLSGAVQRPFVPFYIKILVQNKQGASVFNTLLKKRG